jgi:hypothetical protein
MPGSVACKQRPVVGFEPRSGLVGVSLGIEEVRIHLERDGGVRVAELPRDEYRIVPLRDQDALEGMAKDVERHALQACAIGSLLESSRGEVAMTGRVARRCAEHQVALG